MPQNRVNPVQVQKYLRGIDYPAKKNELVKRAREQGADQNVISTLESLPDQEFKTPKDVSRAIGEEM